MTVAYNGRVGLVRTRSLVLAQLFLVGLLWLVYGPLAPCPMLRHDPRARLVRSQPSADVVARWSRAFGTAVLDAALEPALRDRGAARCARDLVRLHLGARPEDLLLGL